MREDEDCDDDNEDDNDEESDCSLPKRVLGFTTLKLLKLFAKSERGSLNGTFKSCCKLWKQQFVFMLKFKKHWIPVIWGWLPDKTEISYKVRLLFTFLTGIMQCSHKWNVFSFHDLWNHFLLYNCKNNLSAYLAEKCTYDISSNFLSQKEHHSCCIQILTINDILIMSLLVVFKT